MLQVVRADTNERWLDVGTGAWSSWPYLLADATGAEIVAVDIGAGIHRQTDRRRRAAAAGLRRAVDILLVRGDGRAFPLTHASFDGVTAVPRLSTSRAQWRPLGVARDRSRTSTGGQALVSLPLRSEAARSNCGENAWSSVLAASPEFAIAT